jgi:hypothetical protein
MGETAGAGEYIKSQILARDLMVLAPGFRFQVSGFRCREKEKLRVNAETCCSEAAAGNTEASVKSAKGHRRSGFGGRDQIYPSVTNWGLTSSSLRPLVPVGPQALLQEQKDRLH